MRYRRAQTPGATYFFTVVIYNCQPLFRGDETITLLRKAFHSVKAESPFTIDAIVILPDHIHSIWTLPEDDATFHLGGSASKPGLACGALKPINSNNLPLTYQRGVTIPWLFVNTRPMLFRFQMLELIRKSH